jgi:hypothetical protein
MHVDTDPTEWRRVMGRRGRDEGLPEVVTSSGTTP